MPTFPKKNDMYQAPSKFEKQIFDWVLPPPGAESVNPFKMIVGTLKLNNFRTTIPREYFDGGITDELLTEYDKSRWPHLPAWWVEDGAPYTYPNYYEHPSKTLFDRNFVHCMKYGFPGPRNPRIDYIAAMCEFKFENPTVLVEKLRSKEKGCVDFGDLTGKTVVDVGTGNGTGGGYLSASSLY